MNRYVIIGTGAAGIAAAEAIRSQDAQGWITLLTQDLRGYYSRPGLAYYLTGEIPESILFPFDEKDFRRLNVQILRTPVVRIAPSQHRVELSNGDVLPYGRLLIATGSYALLPIVPGVDLSGVVKLDDLDDAQKILKLARKGCTAVVLGGGITALEILEGLVARGVRVHYLLRSRHYWNNVLDETESHMVESHLTKQKVQIHRQTELVEILGKDGRVVGVRTQAGEILKCDLVAIAIGVLPRIELAVAAGLQTERGILVNEMLQTSDPDVFAAGDVAQVYDPFSGKTVLDTLWGTARDKGHYAGLNMAGYLKPYRKSVSFNVTRLAGLTTTIIGEVGGGRDADLTGIGRGDSEVWRQSPGSVNQKQPGIAVSSHEVNRLRILVGERNILGAVVMGDQEPSRPLQELIGHNVDITPIRESLLQPGASIENIVYEFWSKWSVQHAETRSTS